MGVRQQVAGFKGGSSPVRDAAFAAWVGRHQRGGHACEELEQRFPPPEALMGCGRGRPSRGCRRSQTEAEADG